MHLKTSLNKLVRNSAMGVCCCCCLPSENYGRKGVTLPWGYNLGEGVYSGRGGILWARGYTLGEGVYSGRGGILWARGNSAMGV